MSGETPKLAADTTVRSRLLQAAVTVFNQKGYAATSVREIVESAGVTKPVLYYHFANKEGIYLAILEESLSIYKARLEALKAAKGSVKERIRGVCAEVFRLSHENMSVVRLVYAVFYGPPQGAPPFDFELFHGAFYGAIRDLAAEGIRSGELRPGDPDDYAMALHGAASVCWEIELAHCDCKVGEEGLRRVLDVVFDGLVESSTTVHA